LIWALIFATAAVMGGSVFGLHGGFWDTILIRPLAAMSMFVLALWAPLMLLRHAHGGVGHPVGRLAGYASMRLATNAMSAQLPERFGGRRSPGAAPVPELQMTRDLEAGAVRGGQPSSVPVNRDASDAVQTFLDGASNAGASGVLGSAFPAKRENDVRRSDEAPATTTAGGVAPTLTAVARPTEDAERFALRDPARLSFADSLATERVKGRAAQSEPSVAEGQAALESFTPRMQTRIRDQYGLAAPASGGADRIDGSGFRATMAASALSEAISERQAGSLAVLAGMGDDGLSELFAASRGVAFAGGDLSPAAGPRPEPPRQAGERHTERRRAPSPRHLATFEDELSDRRQAPLIVEQPAPPSGRE
jgi:hypothetical protein